MEQAIINVEGTTTIETAVAAKKLIEMFGNQNVRAISVNRVNDKSDEVIVELDFVPGLAPHLHGFTLQVNGLTCGYAGTGPSNLYEVLQAAGVSEAQVAREDITQKSTKTIPLRLEQFKPKLCRVAKTVATLAKHISASSTIHEKASTWQMVGNAAKLRLISFKPVSE